MPDPWKRYRHGKTLLTQSLRKIPVLKILLRCRGNTAGDFCRRDIRQDSRSPPQDRPHDYDVDEPRFDTQTGERLDRPKKKYPGVILTLAVTAAAVGAFIYAVLPGKLPSLGTVEEDDVETEIHLAVASTESDETEAAFAAHSRQKLRPPGASWKLF